MSEIGHGRLATLRDLHTVMPKHAVAYIITCLEINKYITSKRNVTGTYSSALANSMHYIVTIQYLQELIHSNM
jgi:hypothetical protein